VTYIWFLALDPAGCGCTAAGYRSGGPRLRRKALKRAPAHLYIQRYRPRPSASVGVRETGDLHAGVVAYIGALIPSAVLDYKVTVTPLCMVQEHEFRPTALPPTTETLSYDEDSTFGPC